MVKDKWQGSPPHINFPSLCYISFPIFYYHPLFLCFSTWKSFLCLCHKNQVATCTFFPPALCGTKRCLKDVDVLYKVTIGMNQSWSTWTKLTERKRGKGRALTQRMLQGSSGCFHHTSGMVAIVTGLLYKEGCFWSSVFVHVFYGKKYPLVHQCHN